MPRSDNEEAAEPGAERGAEPDAQTASGDEEAAEPEAEPNAERDAQTARREQAAATGNPHDALFKYTFSMARIWGRHERAQRSGAPLRLPVIVPLVLLHGPDGWSAPRRLGALLDGDAELLAMVSPWVPDFGFVIDDLSAESDAALRRRSMTALGRLVLWCFKWSRDLPQLLSRLHEWAEVAEQARTASDGAQAFGAVMRYIHFINGHVPDDEVAWRLAACWGEDAREVYVTNGERLIQQGKEQGIQLGKEQGRREVLLELLRTRFGELDEPVLRRVQSTQAEDLQRWTQRVLTASTLQEVLS